MSTALPVRGLIVAAMVTGALGSPAAFTVSAAHAGARVPCTATVSTTGSAPADLAGKVPAGTTGRLDATCGDMAQTTVDQVLPAVQADVRGFEAKVKSEWGPLCVVFSAGADEIKAGLAALGLTDDVRALAKQPRTEQGRLDKIMQFVTAKRCPASAA
ncbi:hypothetical protein AB0O34_18765 [Sphaerisporangium sp. NPDC088356]|uniref:hypothetical protein n=1 Tax=Sphaerisporangium sp. NPDC088356 TaxID=3154871 RepID=UPI00341717DF